MDADGLLKGARRLDRVVLVQIFDVFYPKIFTYIVFRIGDAKVSAQIATQVFADLLDVLSKHAGPAKNLAGWLYQSAGSLVYAYLQSISFELPQRVSDAEMILDETAELVAAPGATGYRMQSIFQSLTPEHQHILALRFSDRYSIDELSRILDKSPRVVKEQQFQALKALQHTLQARMR